MTLYNYLKDGCSEVGVVVFTESQNHRITESQNVRGWKGHLWVI